MCLSAMFYILVKLYFYLFQQVCLSAVVCVTRLFGVLLRVESSPEMLWHPLSVTTVSLIKGALVC